MMHDPKNPRGARRAAWLAAEVQNILDGIPAKGESRIRKSASTGTVYKLYRFDLNCGCIADDETGWKACAGRLHSALASEPARSAQTVRYIQLRTLFDQLLAEAWKVRANKGPYLEREIREHYHIGLSRYQADYDLLGKSIYQLGSLASSLSPLPDRDSIYLYKWGQ